MNFGQTLWGNLTITLFMLVIPLLPVLLILAVYYFNRQSSRAAFSPSALRANFILSVLALVGLAVFGLFSLPYPSVSRFAASLSPGSRLVSLNESVYTSAAIVMRLLGAACRRAPGHFAILVQRIAELVQFAFQRVGDEELGL